MARFNKGQGSRKNHANQYKAENGKQYGMRKSQLFGPWGIGAILPCPDGSSVMIAGLDRFPQGELDAIDASYRRIQPFLAACQRTGRRSRGTVPSLDVLSLLRADETRQAHLDNHATLRKSRMQKYAKAGFSA